MEEIKQEVLDVLGKNGGDMTANDVHNALVERGTTYTFGLVEHTLVQLAVKKKVTKYKPPSVYRIRT